MDGRWTPLSRDSKRQARVILHPTAALWEVRQGLDPGSDDSIDLSDFVTSVTQSAFEVSVALSFNRELFGTSQPKPNQILEVQLWQNDEWKPLWLGLVDAINQFTLQRGTRSMQVVAKTREQQDIWKHTKRITPLFPQLTNLTHIATRVARSAGMRGDEILLPPSAMTTAHSNTQMADMNAWDMLETLFTAMGWTPFIDSLGRLRAADRGLQGRIPDVTLTDDRMVKVGGQRQRPPVSRVKVNWLNPTLKKYFKQDQLLGNPVIITLGWFIPYWKRTVWFSEDHTLRADHTRINWDTSSSVNHFAEEWLKFPKGFVDEQWIQQAENKGKLSFKNWQSVGALAAFITLITITSRKKDFVEGTIVVPPDGTLVAAGFGANVVSGTILVKPPMVRTQPAPTGSMAEGIALGAWATMAMTIGTGTYEIWGTPYDWVHARNTTEAFDSSVPLWVDNSVEIESDFIVNEEHAKAMAIRELIYQARAANKWTVTIVDDPRIEYGDILAFPDGTQIYVEDFTRQLERGAEAVLDIKGFLVNPLTGGAGGGSVVPPIDIGLPGGGDIPGGPGEGEGGGGGGLSPGEPATGPGSKGEPIVPMSADPATMEGNIKASLYYFARTDYGYWHGLVSTPWQGGNAKWYIGWDAYMEQRAAPGDTGSADHSLLPLPAVHQTPPPDGYPSGGWT